MRSLLLTTCLLAGCAQVTAIPVTPDNPDPDGLPFFAHKPILVVSSAGARVEIIPNLNERYALQMHSFLAKNHTKFDIGPNGTVISVDANLDSASIISFFEKALDKVPSGDTAGSTAPESQGDVAVYEFVFQSDGKISLRKLMLWPMEPKSQHTTPESTPPTDRQESDSGSVKPIAEEQ